MDKSSTSAYRPPAAVSRQRVSRSSSPPRGVSGQRVGAALFLIAAAASFVLSVTLWFTDNHQAAIFGGLWVPSILAAGAFWIVAAGAR